MHFNEQQKKIINNIKGVYIISAPVGTGKTTVLTERIITALQAGIKPEEILCLTFTNRAAEEMINRIKARLSDKNIFDALTIKTFHGFCAYFIRAEAKRIGLNPEFIIIDEAEQVEIMENILEKYPDFFINSYNKKRQIFDLLNKFYHYRLNKLESEIGCNVSGVILSEFESEIGQKYRNTLEDQNALDFNELVLLTIRNLYLDDKLKNKWQKKYKFIQLDEFQDTHLSEYLVVKELAKYHQNISFIGDLDQTIYGWRGSEPFFIIQLIKKHFPSFEEFSLQINYRFNESLLKSVRSFLGSFIKPATKKIISSSKEQESDEKPIQVFRGHNLSEEISWLVDNIKTLKNNKPEAKIAVLTRANGDIKRIADIFSEKNIAHITVDKYDFFRRQEVRDVYAYLKIIFNEFDLESAYRIVLRPPRQIGPATLKKIREKGGHIGLRVSDFLSFKNYNFIEPFVNLIKQWEKGRIIVLDTETTGTNVLQDEIIQIYAIEVINGKMGRDFHLYLKNTIPVGVSGEIHGLTDEFLLKEGSEPKEALVKLKEFINNDCVAGHNVNFDLSMIVENAKRHNIAFNLKEYYDTLDLARRLIRAENYKLTTLANLLGLSSATHDARDDVIATVGLLEILVNKLKVNHQARVDLFQRFAKKFVGLSSLINSWHKEVRTKRPAEALKHIWASSGLEDFYTQEAAKNKTRDENSAHRIKSIETLIDIFQKKDDLNKPADIILRELIHYAALVKDINFLGLEQGKVPVVTVHQVKGLEFDYIFIVGLNEFKFPINKLDLEEEKRIFYVALTRAKKKIFISYSSFDDYGRPQTKSRFIDFLDQEQIEIVN